MSEVVAVSHLSKVYRIYSRPSDRLLELFSFNGKQHHMEVRALDDVTFELERGARLGIVGENGSGKTTLLKILSGVLTPTTGSVHVNGRIAALLALGHSFNPNLTGRQNISQQGIVLGYSEAEMRELAPRMIDFSELGNFIEQPVKTYSSGMSMRLAFSCAAFVQPDILIIDEALSVGDAYFQVKCFHKIKALIDEGLTFIYVSHNSDEVKSLCDRAILLEHGRLVLSGTPKTVGDYYQSLVYERQVNGAWWRESRASAETESGPAAAASSAEQRSAPLFRRSEEFSRRAAGLRQGNGDARIVLVEVLDAHGQAIQVAEHGQKLRIRIHIESYAPLEESSAVGAAVCDRTGQQILQFMSDDKGIPLGATDSATQFVVDFAFDNILKPGDYSINAGIAEMTTAPWNSAHRMPRTIYDTCSGATVFAVSHLTETAIHGQVSIPYDVSLHA